MADKKIKKGDHVFVHHFFYTHHGIATGDGTVIQYEGKLGSNRHGRVVESSWEDFAECRTVHVKQHPYRAYRRSEVVARARSRLGEQDYNLVMNNCEHFVYWCVEGNAKSEQVRAVGGASAAGATMSIQRLAAAKTLPSLPSPTRGEPIQEIEQFARWLTSSKTSLVQKKEAAMVLDKAIALSRSSSVASSVMKAAATSGKASAVTKIVSGSALASSGSLTTGLLTSSGIGASALGASAIAAAPVLAPVAGIALAAIGIKKFFWD